MTKETISTCRIPISSAQKRFVRAEMYAISVLSATIQMPETDGNEAKVYKEVEL